MGHWWVSLFSDSDLIASEYLLERDSHPMANRDSENLVWETERGTRREEAEEAKVRFNLNNQRSSQLPGATMMIRSDRNVIRSPR